MHKTIAGAVCDFAAFLSTREEPITLGAGQSSACQLVDLLDEWSALRGLDITEANVATWEDCLKPDTYPVMSETSNSLIMKSVAKL